MNEELRAMKTMRTVVAALQFLVDQAPMDGYNRRITLSVELGTSMEFIDEEIEKAREKAKGRYTGLDR